MQNKNKTSITMSDLAIKCETMFQFSVKLCSAVKKHECLYLQTAPTVKNAKWENAWKEVAEECGESVDNCKCRWMNIRKAFLRCLRKDTKKYYLHNFMEFLIPAVKDLNGEGKSNEIVGDDSNDESDSDTTSADETHIQKTEINKKLKEELPSSPTDDNEKNVDHVGDFVINEIVSPNNDNDHGDDDDDDMDESVETIRSRLRYRRACKRGLDVDLKKEPNTEEKQEEKRPRRSADRRKDLSNVSSEESSTRSKSLSNTKKIEVKVNKTKFNKTLSTQPKHIEKQPNTENKTMYTSIAVNTATTVSTFYPKNSPENTIHVSEPPNITEPMKTSTNILHDPNLNLTETPLLIDMATMTDFQTKDSSTQYEAPEPGPADFDDTFINSLKPQLKLMNGRQKMNFKRKVFQSLMEVFDDAANFPNSDEYIVLPPTGAPRFDNTTTGELRLMRELVALVQAAKTTPEIGNVTATAGNANVTYSSALEKPSTPQTTAASKTSSPLSMSPNLDDDDLNISNGLLINDNELPRSLEEIIDLRSEDEVLGLPRRIIHKVVKVAGTNGSTIVTGEGKQRRVYRIYPKAGNSEASRGLNTKNNANGPNIGTFYVTPSKVAASTAANTDMQNHANKSKISTSNFTFRAVNKPPSINNSRDNFLSTNAINRSLSNVTVTKTPITAKDHQGTPILNQSTGLFMIPSPASKTPTSNNNHSNKSPMFPPPISSGLFSNNNSNNSAMRIVSVKSNTNSGGVINQNNIMQRRYSICGPATAVTKPVHILPKPQPKPFIQKITYSQGNPVKSAVSNIMISKSVSLKQTTNSLSNVKSFLANTSKNVVSSPTSAESTATNKVNEPSTKQPQPSNEEKSVSANNTDAAKTPPESPKPSRNSPEIPILETAGTIAADPTFADPLYVKPTNKSAAETLEDPLFVRPMIKSEPLD